jgi:hypothetical protein
MNVRSCDVARRLSLISGSPFLGETPPLGEKPSKAFVTIKGKLVPFDSSTRLDFSAVATICERNKMPRADFSVRRSYY